jgi:hypothetical protein
MKKNRLLTVSSVVCERDYQHVHVPYIRLSGKWLEAAGFAAGDTISVEPQLGGGLLIRKVEGQLQDASPVEKRIGPASKKMMTVITRRIAVELPVKSNTGRF